MANKIFAPIKFGGGVIQDLLLALFGAGAPHERASETAGKIYFNDYDNWGNWKYRNWDNNRNKCMGARMRGAEFYRIPRYWIKRFLQNFRFKFVTTISESRGNRVDSVLLTRMAVKAA